MKIKDSGLPYSLKKLFPAKIITGWAHEDEIEENDYDDVWNELEETVKIK